MTRALGILILLSICNIALPQLHFESIPVENIHPGMVGEGRTVFSGNTIESFRVEILGVMHNSGPKSKIILSELSGGPLAHTGVIAGMSGSPVYIDGKLIGAIAFAFPFAKDPIAGITPIQEMIEATQTTSQRRSIAKLDFPLTSKQLSEAIPKGLQPTPILNTPLRTAERIQKHLGKNLTPISMPATVIGMPSTAFELLAPFLRQLGIEPFMGGAAPHTTSEPLPVIDNTLTPGDAVSVGLVTGDIQISASGTVTHVNQETGAVYAFGHPLFNLGPINFPMKRANVHLVLPSIMNSFKMASSGETIGTWLQDRSTAIKGVLGIRPDMIPLQVSVRNERTNNQTYELELINDNLLSPVLAYSSLIAILKKTEREFGNQTVKMSAWLETASHGSINIEDIFVGPQATVSASGTLAGPLSFLMNNDFEEIELQKIEIDIETTEEILTAEIDRAWLSNTRTKPGDTVELKILMKSYRGEEILKSLDITIPPGIRAGNFQLLIADGPTLSNTERSEIGQPFKPKDTQQLVRTLNTLRKHSHLYVRLSRMEPTGAIVAGEYLSTLPPSVLNMLQTDDSSNEFTLLKQSTYWENTIKTEFSVSGKRLLHLEIKRP